MKDQSLLTELLNKTKFIYNKEKTPEENYLEFQRCICFQQGVEFLTSHYESTTPIFYLLAVPGLSIDLQIAEQQLKEFHANIISHLEEIQKTEDNLYQMFAYFYDLDKAVLKQQIEYHYGREEYFGAVTVYEHPSKAVSELNLKKIGSYYRGTFLNAGLTDRHPVNYENLGSELKEHLGQLYMLRRKYNMKLIDHLKYSRKIFFERENIANYYKYKKETSDLVELALAITQTGAVYSYTNGKVNINDFCRDFCSLFGVQFTKLSNYLPTITSRFNNNDLFTTKTPELIGKCLQEIYEKYK